jgi:hypothetical protein
MPQTAWNARRGPLVAILGLLTLSLLVFQLRSVLDAADFVGANKTYTLDADFDLGTLFNVTHNSPHNNELRLSETPTTFNVMWIANAGEDTVSKIDTTTGKELARYRTGFGPAGQPGYIAHLFNAYAGPAPSRTGVDTDGNLYIANRHFDNKPGEALKVLSEGGVDRNGNGVIDTSTDLDNNGVIGPGEILPMGDANGDGLIQISEVQDERVVWVQRVGPNNGLGRSLCLDPDGDVWLGLYNTGNYYKLDKTTGAQLVGPINAPGNTPYGCLVDGSGILWGASLATNLVKLNTNTNTHLNTFSHSAFGSDYGIALGNGVVYQGVFGNGWIRFDPATNTFTKPHAVNHFAHGVATDGAGFIYTANGANGVTKWNDAGAIIWSAPGQAGQPAFCWGVQIDGQGNVWCIPRDANVIAKYRGTDGAALGVFPVGNTPYTYSDATGISSFSTTNPLGRWTIVQDSSTAGNAWDKISWNAEPQGSVPAGTSIAVEARAANTEAGLAGLAFTAVTNGSASPLTGRFIELRATLTSNDPNATPVLSDLSITTEQVTVLSCDADGDGDVDTVDLGRIRTATGQTAGANDPRDGNKDGKINVADVRYCSLRCTRPACSTNGGVQ